MGKWGLRSIGMDLGGKLALAVAMEGMKENCSFIQHSVCQTHGL